MVTLWPTWFLFVAMVTNATLMVAMVTNATLMVAMVTNATLMVAMVTNATLMVAMVTNATLMVAMVTKLSCALLRFPLTTTLDLLSLELAQLRQEGTDANLRSHSLLWSMTCASCTCPP